MGTDDEIDVGENEFFWAGMIGQLVRGREEVEEIETYADCPEKIAANEFVFHTYDEKHTHFRVWVKSCDLDAEAECPKGAAALRDMMDLPTVWFAALRYAQLHDDPVLEREAREELEDMKIEVTDLLEQPDPWGNDEEFPLKDWQHEVSDNNTRQGYWDWVEHQRESKDDETSDD